MQSEEKELINSENLNEEPVKRYIARSIKSGFASDKGADLHEILPKMRPLHPEYGMKQSRISQKISAFVEKFKGVLYINS